MKGVNGKSICLSVKKTPLEKTGMSFPEAEGSDRSAIPGRPIAGVDGGGGKEDNTGCGSGRLCEVVHPPINAASSSTTLEVLHRSGGLLCLFVLSSKRGILKWCPHRLHKDDNPSWLLLQRAFRPEILGCVIQTVLRVPRGVRVCGI